MARKTETASTTPWRRWASRTTVTRLTAGQAYAAALIQAGIADTPEDAFRKVQKEEPEAATSGQHYDFGKTTRDGDAYGKE